MRCPVMVGKGLIRQTQAQQYVAGNWRRCRHRSGGDQLQQLEHRTGIRAISTVAIEVDQNRPFALQRADNRPLTVTMGLYEGCTQVGEQRVH